MDWPDLTTAASGNPGAHEATTEPVVKGIVLFYNGERGKAVRKALFGAGHEIQVAFTPQAFPTVDQLRAEAPLLSIVAGFPIIFKKDMIGVPKYGTINCHAGPVPNYRGGSPLNWQIINGETQIWVSLLRMDEGLDTGPVIASTSFKLEATRNHQGSA